MAYSVAAAEVVARPSPGIENPATVGRWRFLLVVLWLAWAVVLAAALWLGSRNEEPAESLALWGRMGSSVLLVLAALVWTLVCRDLDSSRYATLIAMGMTLGLVGDLFNANLLKMGLNEPVLGGIISFGLGHLCYIAACFEAARRAQLLSKRAFWGSLAAWWAIGVVSWYFVAYRGTEAVDLRWPGLAYTLLLAGTAAMATALAIQDKRFVLLALGATLFLVSDLVLAIRMFHGPFNNASELVWVLYGPAQMLIVYALATSLGAMQPTPALTVSD